MKPSKTNTVKKSPVPLETSAALELVWMPLAAVIEKLHLSRSTVLRMAERGNIRKFVLRSTPGKIGGGTTMLHWPDILRFYREQSEASQQALEAAKEALQEVQ